MRGHCHRTIRRNGQSRKATVKKTTCGVRGRMTEGEGSPFGEEEILSGRRRCGDPGGGGPNRKEGPCRDSTDPHRSSV